MRRAGLALLIVGAALVSAGCATATATVEPLSPTLQPPTNRPPTSQPPTDPPPTAALVPSVSVSDQTAVEVTIVDTEFRKPVINVTLGTTVTWVYQGTFPHTVTADDGSFDSGTLSAGDSFSYTFTKVGTVAYYCRIHGGPGGQGMSGIVIVNEY